MVRGFRASGAAKLVKDTTVDVDDLGLARGSISLLLNGFAALTPSASGPSWLGRLNFQGYRGTQLSLALNRHFRVTRLWLMSNSLCMLWYYSPRPSLVADISDAHFALAAPIAVCWSASPFFHYLDTSGWTALDRYRIHESSEGVSRNRVPRTAVIRNILLQQGLQTALRLLSLRPTENPTALHAEMVAFAPRLVLADALREPALCRAAYFISWWPLPLFQLLAAMYVFRALWHHRIYVPYAFAASYNHTIKGFFMNAVGAFLAQFLARLNTRQAALLLCLVIAKPVDDHCGYCFPLDPLQFLSQNSADFPDIHH
ncbi:hypothetical protein FB451DRAFT_1565345 [Mycena latifolia]|nr:hypothetical protein FB451DRAFT_1565345 [Mycena latifolia]